MTTSRLISRKDIYYTLPREIKSNPISNFFAVVYRDDYNHTGCIDFIIAIYNLKSDELMPQAKINRTDKCYDHANVFFCITQKKLFAFNSFRSNHILESYDLQNKFEWDFISMTADIYICYDLIAIGNVLWFYGIDNCHMHCIWKYFQNKTDFVKYELDSQTDFLKMYVDARQRICFGSKYSPTSSGEKEFGTYFNTKTNKVGQYAIPNPEFVYVKSLHCYGYLKLEITNPFCGAYLMPSRTNQSTDEGERKSYQMSFVIAVALITTYSNLFRNSIDDIEFEVVPYVADY